MQKPLTIKEMARRTHLSEHTLRYYERIGLIKAITRSKSGHRHYSPLDQAWIEFLIRLRSTGMPIREMQRFAELRHQGDKTAGKRREILKAHLTVVQKNIIELTDYKKILINKIKYYKTLEEKS